jgi:hypothetical protein
MTAIKHEPLVGVSTGLPTIAERSERLATANGTPQTQAPPAYDP